MEDHKARVARVAEAITSFQKSSTPFRIYHGTTNSTRPSARTHANTVDISDLNHVINIDTTAKTCLVEPNVAMDALIAVALQHNLVPPVIPEFPGITVGGAFAGTAGESSSFRYGFFEDCVSWTEIVLADGEVVIASCEENAELFNGSKGTFGTLGVGTLFEVRLVDARRFVHLRYEMVSSGVTQAKEIMIRECSAEKSENEFVDGIMFSKETGVILIGKMTDGISEHPDDDDRTGLPVVTFSNPSDPWFYLHVQEVLETYLNNPSQEAKSVTYEELIPLKDYLFRYDRGAFWTGRHAFSYFLTPFNKITRRIFDWFMHTRTMYHALHRSGLMQHFIIQDMAVPWANVESIFEWLDEGLGIYPLWLAPLKIGTGGMQLNPKFVDTTGLADSEPDLVLNVGVWGFSPHNSWDANRQIEAELTKLKGRKWLYSQTFYTRDEFWSIYDQKWYDKLRTRYRAHSLPDIYEKVGGTALNNHNALTGIWSVWPLAGVYGVLSTLKGGDYLRKR